MKRHILIALIIISRSAFCMDNPCAASFNGLPMEIKSIIIEHAIQSTVQSDSLDKSIKEFARLHIVNRDLQAILSDSKTTEHFLKLLGKKFKTAPSRIAMQYQNQVPALKAWLDSLGITHATIISSTKQLINPLKEHKVATLLVQSDPNMSIDPTNNTVLMHAVYNNNEPLTSKLLQYADPNVKNSRGWSALIFAIKGASPAIIRALLVAGADPNVQTISSKTTPLMIAADSNNTEAIRLLLIYKANLSLQDKDGDTALLIAQKKDNKEAIEILNHDSGPKNKMRNR